MRDGRRTVQRSDEQEKSFYFNSKASAEKEAAELKRLGWKDVRVVPANDSAKRQRLHRALDAVMDSRKK